MSNKPVVNCLEIINDKGIVTESPCSVGDKQLNDNKPRSASSSGRKAPPVCRTNSANLLRCLTPTKKITLQTVKRKDEIELPSSEVMSVEVNKLSVSSPQLIPSQHQQRTSSTVNREARKQATNHKSAGDNTTISSTGSNVTVAVATTSSEATGGVSCNGATRATSCNGATGGVSCNGATGGVSCNGATGGADGDAEEENESSGDEEPIKAPSELLLEFLDCVMNGDFVNAKKLCRMILIYEPTNVEALNFQPLIEQKLALDDSSSSAEDDDDDDETSTDDDSSEDEDLETESSSSDEHTTTSPSSSNTNR